jgi:hypothetical protein
LNSFVNIFWSCIYLNYLIAVKNLSNYQVLENQLNELCTGKDQEELKQCGAKKKSVKR